MIGRLKRALRDVLSEEATYFRLMETLHAKGPSFPESERVLCGTLLAGDAVERDLLPCRAMDFSVPLCRAVYVGCCAFPAQGSPNTRIAKIILAMEADGHWGIRDSIDTLLEWSEYYRGEDIRPHIRCVSEAGKSRRMAQYLERLAEEIRANRLTADQAERQLRKEIWPNVPTGTSTRTTSSGVAPMNLPAGRTAAGPERG